MYEDKDVDGWTGLDGAAAVTDWAGLLTSVEQYGDSTLSVRLRRVSNFLIPSSPFP